MSGFLSEKYLAYKKPRNSGDTPPASGEVDSDYPCPTCGYNLRGLARGARCPECGEDETGTANIGPEGKKRTPRPLIDIAAADDKINVRTWTRAVHVGMWCVLSVLVLRAFLQISVTISGTTPQATRFYVLAGAAIATVWMVVVPLILPRAIGELWPWTRRWRMAAVWSQPLWMIACAMWALYLLTGRGPSMVAISYVFQTVALAGTVIVAVLMRHIASECELHDATRRFNNVAWFLPITALVATFISNTFVATGPLGRDAQAMLSLIFRTPPLLFVGLLLWVLGYFSLGLWQLKEHGRWTGRFSVDLAEREQRIKKRREEIERENAARVRDLPEVEGDLPMESE